MSLNKDQAAHEREQLHKDAIKEEVRKALLSSKVPVTVAYIVKRTGHGAALIREMLLEMIEDGHAREIAWMYTV